MARRIWSPNSALYLERESRDNTMIRDRVTLHEGNAGPPHIERYESAGHAEAAPPSAADRRARTAPARGLNRWSGGASRISRRSRRCRDLPARRFEESESGSVSQEFRVLRFARRHDAVPHADCRVDPSVASSGRDGDATVAPGDHLWFSFCMLPHCPALLLRKARGLVRGGADGFAADSPGSRHGSLYHGPEIG